MKDKTCKAITKKNTRCTKTKVIGNYCLPHFFMSKGLNAKRKNEKEKI